MKTYGEEVLLHVGPFLAMRLDILHADRSASPAVPMTSNAGYI